MSEPIPALDLAYLAGAFDFAGSIRINRKRDRRQRHKVYALTIALTGKDPDALGAVRDAFGIGQVRRHTNNSWRWTLWQNDAHTFLDLIDDYAVLKRPEIQVARKFRAAFGPRKSRRLTPTILAMRDRCYLELRELNKY
jgi:hypothetical protein